MFVGTEFVRGRLGTLRGTAGLGACCSGSVMSISKATCPLHAALGSEGQMLHHWAVTMVISA